MLEPALFISFLSLGIAALALGWNIYRDVILKARIVVSFGVHNLVTTQGHGGTFLLISATNLGPGVVTVTMIHGKNHPWWRRLLKPLQRFVVIPNYTNPLNGRLPSRLDVGDRIDHLLPYEEGCVLANQFTHLGVGDSFGRSHWAPKRQVREAKEQFKKDFPGEPTTRTNAE